MKTGDRGPGSGDRLPQQDRADVCALAALALLLGLVGCASSRERISARAEAPMASVAAGWHEEGLASWYGEPYHGRATASGERYDMKQMTAAHRTLPFGTRIRVRNLDSGREAEVVINDRGPFVTGRVLDLSWAAARELGALGPGVVPVRLTVLAAGDGMLTEPCWEVQVGAFGQEENVKRARSSLGLRGFEVRLAPAGGGLTRVRISRLSGRARALDVAAALGVDYPGAAAVPCGGGW